MQLHPENPRYLLFRGRPTVLITSGEHYGAVVNLDFDIARYLDELARHGLNLTRVFSGAMIEGPQSIVGVREENTLAPRPGRLAVPWARSDAPGYAGGGNKFDLTRWDRAYFDRLSAFIAQAGQRNIVVELVLFGTHYNDYNWSLSPLNAGSNVNGIGSVGPTEVHKLAEPGLTEVQEALVRQIAAELKGYDNLYYEIINEPYVASGASDEWQDRMIETLVQAEAGSASRHLIARNIANGAQKVVRPNPAVSIFNFHYATPATVSDNDALDRVIADDETGFSGTSDATYRRQAWRFILAGGGIFDNLDWSFSARHPDGTFAYPQDTPGGGSAALRHQLGVLKEFIHRFDFVRMKTDSMVLPAEVPEGGQALALADPGKAYAIYLEGRMQPDLALALPAGAYEAEWIDTCTGNVARAEAFEHHGGRRTLVAPRYDEEIALRIVSAENRR
jgi:Cellulase (glycosyl hydrolase family 5)